MEHCEVVAVGESFAGLPAALQLARAHRRILLVDSAEPRNRFAAAVHEFLYNAALASAAGGMAGVPAHRPLVLDEAGGGPIQA